MSVEAMTVVFKQSKSKGAARLVLLALADEASSTGEVTAYRRSQSWLGKKCNMEARSVRRCIDDLVALGELEVLSAGQGRSQSNYRIVLMREDVVSSPREDVVSSRQDVVSSPSSRSLPLEPVPSCPTSSDVDVRFEKFWKIYPRKEGKKAARSAFKSMVKRHELEAARAALSTHMMMWTEQERPIDKIPLAASWLNGQRYLDVIAPSGNALILPKHRYAGQIRYRSDGSRFQYADDGSEIDLPPEDEMPNDWETAHIDPYGDTP